MMAVASLVLWSSGYVGAALTVDTSVAPATLLAWRYVVTASVLILACLAVPRARHGLAHLSIRDVSQQGVFAVLSHVVYLGGLFLASARDVDAGTSALICALQPMVVTAISRVAFGDPLRPGQVIGLLVSLGGVALCVGGVQATGPLGFAMVVASLVALCAASLLERAWHPRMPVLTSLTVQVVIAAIVFVMIALCRDGLAVDVTPPLALAIAWLVVLSGLGGYATFIWCLRNLGSTPTSTLLYLSAPVTMLWAWATFGQVPDPAQWIGLATVLSGVALSLDLRRHGRRPARAPGRPLSRSAST